MYEKKQVKNLPEETELQIENANIDFNKEEENPGIAYEEANIDISIRGVHCK